MAWRISKESASSVFSSLGVSVDDSKRKEVIYNARTNWELFRSETAKTISLANIKHSVSLQDINKEEIMTACKNEQELPLSARAVNLPQRGAENKRTSYSQRRTVSQASESDSNSTKPTSQIENGDFFRLPPLLGSLLQDADEAVESVSSVEPVVDSSLSSLPSESSSESEKGARRMSRLSRSNSTTHRGKHTVSGSRVQTGRVKSKISNPGKVREQGGDYLVEITGRYLNVYGQGALRFIDRPWNPVKAGDVLYVKFNYINFNSLCCVFGKLKQRFPNAEHFLFRETNIYCLGQLNALADIQGLTSLAIHPEGNPICVKDWKSYAIYRLSHWGLRNINDEEISMEDIAKSTEEFQGLSELVLWSLPDSLLQPLLSRLRLETSQQTARHWLWNADPALRTVVAKEALQWRRTNLSQEELVWRHKGRQHLNYLIELTCAAVAKLNTLQEQCPTILRELVRDTLVDYSHLDSYMKECMNKLKLQ